MMGIVTAARAGVPSLRRLGRRERRIGGLLLGLRENRSLPPAGCAREHRTALRWRHSCRNLRPRDDVMWKMALDFNRKGYAKFFPVDPC